MDYNVKPWMTQQEDWNLMCKIVDAVEKAGLNIEDVEDFFARKNPFGKTIW